MRGPNVSKCPATAPAAVIGSNDHSVRWAPQLWPAQRYNTFTPLRTGLRQSAAATPWEGETSEA